MSPHNRLVKHVLEDLAKTVLSVRVVTVEDWTPIVRRIRWPPSVDPDVSASDSFVDMWARGLHLPMPVNCLQNRCSDLVPFQLGGSCYTDIQCPDLSRCSPSDLICGGESTYCRTEDGTGYGASVDCADGCKLPSC